MLKNCLLIFACILISFSTVVFAENVSEKKLENVIKNYIVARVPEVKKEEISLQFAADENIDGLKIGDPGTKIKVLEVLPGFRPAGWVMFPIEIKRGKASRKTFFRVKVEIFRDVVIAVGPIKKQTLITESLIMKDKRDVALLPNKYFRDISSLAGDRKSVV